MSNQYTAPSISGYNSSPPSDDGANTAANEITWAHHKDKLGDPLKNYADAISSAITSAFALNHLASTEAISATDSVVSGDRGKLFICTNTFTLTLLACATAGDGFSFSVRNDGSGTITLDGNSSETINGSATVDIAPGWGAVLVTDGSEWYMQAFLGDADGTFTFLNLTTGNLTVTGTPSLSTALPIASGGTAIDSHPGCRVYRSSAQSISNGGSYQKVQFDTETADVTSAFDNATNYRFTPLEAGLYMVSANVYWASTESGYNYYTSIRKNGSASTIANSGEQVTGTAITITNVSSIIDLNGSTDYVEVYVAQNGTGSVNIGGAGSLTNFCACWIGPSS